MSALADLRQRGVAADRYAFNAAIRVCADAGADDEALRLLGTLREAAAAERAAAAGLAVQQQGHRPAVRHAGSGGRSSASCTVGAMQPDCRSYSAALAAIEAAGRPHRAVQLQRWMEEDGVTPDAMLCTQFLACYAAAGQAAAAQHLFDAMAAGEGSWDGGAVCFRRSTATEQAFACLQCVATPPLFVLADQRCPLFHARPPQPARRCPTARTGTRCCWRMPRPETWRAAPQHTAA